MSEISKLKVPEMAGMNTKCSCGRVHQVEIKNIKIGNNILKDVSSIIDEENILVFCDDNTYEAAGKKVIESLKQNSNRKIQEFIFHDKHLIPNENTLVKMLMAVDKQVTHLIAVGSGTINDSTRYISYKLGIPFSIVATAPSMDGYASVVSPIIIDGVKSTYNAAYPQNIIVDIDVLKTAPKLMLNAGLGDVLGKFNALSDWKIATLLFQEYYCDEVINLVNQALDKCIKSCNDLNKRDDKSMEALIEALILTGLAIGMVGSSRPASGEEHHISHFLEMKSIEEGSYGTWLHGNTVAIGTLATMEALKYLCSIDINQVKADKRYLNLNREKWENNVKQAYQSKAKSMINFKIDDMIFDKKLRENRFQHIIDNWEGIINIAKETLENYDTVKDLLIKNGAPANPKDIGLDRREFYFAVLGAKDIRKRYGVFQLLEDIGLLEEASNCIADAFYA